MELTAEQQIEQLNQARQLIEQDASFYPQIMRGILPIAQKPELALRAWCARFLADGFASPAIGDSEKTALAVECLDTVAALLQTDDGRLRASLIQCAASVYALVFRHACGDAGARDAWDRLATIKTFVLSLWDSGPAGVRLCVIKFAQCVVAAQTAGSKDPRLVDDADVSIATVPPGHAFLRRTELEAEAHGLLDRLLAVFYDETINESRISATLYAVGALAKTRASIAARILNTILAFNPLAARFDVARPARARLDLRFVDKNLRIVLASLARLPAAAPLRGRIQYYLAQLAQLKPAQVDDLLKRRATEAADGDAKRQRLDVPPEAPPPAMAAVLAAPPTVAADASGAVPYARLFSLLAGSPLASFDATQLPAHLATEIAIAGLAAVDLPSLQAASAIVHARLAALFGSGPVLTAPPADDDDDDYDPADTVSFAPDAPAVAAVAAAAAAATTELKAEDDDPLALDAPVDDDDVDAVPLTAAKTLTPAERLAVFQQMIERIFQSNDAFQNVWKFAANQKAAKTNMSKLGINNDTWVVLLSRVSTRGTDAGADDLQDKMAAHVRDRLFAYIMASFRERIDIAVIWLNEEWYNYRLHVRTHPDDRLEDSQYAVWASRMLDSVIPFLDAKDRIFIRFLSDLPELTAAMIQKLKTLCLDPDRAKLGFLALQYLIMLRPPAKEFCLDLIQFLYENHPDTRASCERILQKHRAAVVRAADA
ncbi:uncharacterized protein V1510DRAFT_377327 [Dipodascopsis tothii]|uniref:uncharacterized protein n=1 Tax=Dipodascopsis tothii TaxID=44089 RepID=UPI0034CD14EA